MNHDSFKAEMKRKREAQQRAEFNENMSKI